MHPIVFLILLIVFVVVIGSAAWASFSAATWVPTWKKDLKRMLDLANLKPNETLCDLGCGDGRIIAYAAKNYEIAKAIGYEISLLPYIFAKLKSKFVPGNKMKVIYGSLYKADLRNIDVITCFLMPEALKKLRPKFEKELKCGARIISYTFQILG